MRRITPLLVLAMVLEGRLATAQATEPDTVAPPPRAPSKFRSPDDGWFDLSAFLSQKYGFLPLLIPITEPAVSYGAAGGLAFLDKPMRRTDSGFERPDITAVAGMGTENDTWGAGAGDMREWFDGRLQTVAGIVYASVNLDFYGIGEDEALEESPLRYNLEPKGGMVQAKQRLGDSRFWAGLSYAFARTQVGFEAPDGTPGLPDFDRTSNVGGLTPSLTFDTRDNIFTPTRGTYVEATLGFFGEALGSDDEFEKARVIGMCFFPLPHRLYLGFRGEVASTFGEAPFYMQPFVSLRGAPILRYQGEAVAQIEGELRWQFWKRLSWVGFAGTGQAWNDFEHVDDSQSVVTGGTGFRYELAREYGIHAGLDVAFGPDGTAVYVQIGSAWARP